MQSRLRVTLMVIVSCLPWVVLGALLGLLAKVLVLGLLLGLLLGLIYIYLGYVAADKFILDLYEAEPLDEGVAPRIYEMLSELCVEAGVEAPLIYYIPLKAPNALAVAAHERSPIIAVTQGLTESLGREEVRAILALMVARIADGQAASWSIAAGLSGLPLHWARSAGVNDTLGNRLEIDPGAGLTVFGKFLLTLCVPPCAGLLSIAFDPRAVADTDAHAARMLQKPATLTTALTKIQAGLPQTGWGVSGYNPATALLFAVPPLPPQEALSEANPFWLQAQRAFPYHIPSVADRIQHIKSVGPDAITSTR